MINLYRSPALRRIEASFAAQPLMQRAGATLARHAAALAGRRDLPLLILAGPGNNGGDAIEAARLLLAASFDARLVLAADPLDLPVDARSAWARHSAAGGGRMATIPDEPRWGAIIDGIFGIGLTRPPAGIYAQWISAACSLAERDRCPLIAVDCPSGLDADTGRVIGNAVRASHTLTFIGAKPGLFTADGPDHCGEIVTDALELPASALPAGDGLLVSPTLFSRYLHPRRRNSHKGSFGNAGLLGGAHSMLGALFLAGRSALKLGTGRVYVGLLDPQAPLFDPVQPELMLRRPEGVLDAGLSALACGPGMGNSLYAIDLLEKALSLGIPLVLDADALNLIAFEPHLQAALTRRREPTLLTPHPAEAARLLDSDIGTVQADRIAAATAIAREYRCLVALKGCGTVIAAADGRWWINTSGNPGMASAGMGDVLTGMAAALLAQGWDGEAALLAAVHLHGLAADAAVERGDGPIGLTAGELLAPARRIFNDWCHAAHAGDPAS